MGRRFRSGVLERVICLQATSPLRGLADVAGIDGWAVEAGADEAASFCVARTQPGQCWQRNSSGIAERVVAGGAGGMVPVVYEFNGALYWIRRDVLVSGRQFLRSGLRIYEMPRERSIDIDTELDFLIAERVAEWQGMGA